MADNGEKDGQAPLTMAAINRKPNKALAILDDKLVIKPEQALGDFGTAANALIGQRLTPQDYKNKLATLAEAFVDKVDREGTAAQKDLIATIRNNPTKFNLDGKDGVDKKEVAAIIVAASLRDGIIFDNGISKDDAELILKPVFHDDVIKLAKGLLANNVQAGKTGTPAALGMVTAQVDPKGR